MSQYWDYLINIKNNYPSDPIECTHLCDKIYSLLGKFTSTQKYSDQELQLALEIYSDLQKLIETHPLREEEEENYLQTSFRED